MFGNLAVLCFDCHTETQVRGGFHRKLDAEQVVLYRDDWLNTVAKTRAADLNRLQGIEVEDVAIELELATSLAEIYREREEYELLALHYLSIGNDDLRDKYIDLAIQQGIDDDSLIFFRSEQGRLDLVPQEVINRLAYQLESRADWFSLGRLYVRLEQLQNATRATCRGAINAIENGNFFSAAFYLKEMLEGNTLESLFIASLKQASDRGDLWWQYRALQELEWHSEAREFLLENQEEIEASEEPHFIEQLTVATNDKHRYVELRKEEALLISAKKGAEYPAWAQHDETNSDLPHSTPGLNNNQE